jgi:hypothetical protein
MRKNLSGGFDATHHGKPDIQEDQIGSKDRGLLNGVEPMGRFANNLPVMVLLQPETDEPSPGFIVVNQQNAIGQWSLLLVERSERASLGRAAALNVESCPATAFPPFSLFAGQAESASGAPRCLRESSGLLT